MKRVPKRRTRPAPGESIEAPDATVLDLLDHLVDKGAMLDGDVTLGVAGVELIYVRLSTLLCAAGRLSGKRRA